MVYYNWHKIYKKANGNAFKCWEIFYYVASKHVSKSYRDPLHKYVMSDFKGQSFIANERPLINNAHKYTYKEVSQYLALASIRNLADYLAYKKLTLDVLHIPMPLELFSKNRLLYIKDDNLHFLFEELPKED